MPLIDARIAYEIPCMKDSRYEIPGGSTRELNDAENLLYVRLGFEKVGQHI